MDEITKEKLARIGALYVAHYELGGTLESEVDGLTSEELSEAFKLAPLGSSAISVIGESALDVLARTSVTGTNRGYVDADEAYAFGPNSLDDKGLILSKEGPFPEIGHELTFIELGQNDIKSGHISAIACDVALEDGNSVERIFVRYKGGDLYRYWPFKDGHSRWGDLVQTCVRMKQALPTELTIGEYVERVLKVAHEQDKVTCERLDSYAKVWVTALKPSEVQARRAGTKGRKKAQPSYAEEMAVETAEAEQAGARHYGAVVLPTMPATPGEGTEGEDARGPEEVPSL